MNDPGKDELTPTDNTQEARYRLGVQRIYQNDRIAVTWEPKLCIHVGYCFRGLPNVFNPVERPWVDVNAAAPDEIAAAVIRCPTGALGFERKDGGAQEFVPDETIISERTNGPLYMHGRLRVQHQDGSIREATRLALCRCGGSSNKPYCDGTHNRNGFRTYPPSR
jgi:CDGSH-type Zn-finger protein/uncharacterized Fe-S cluster protein YjdI